jgi:hypothetical protein
MNLIFAYFCLPSSFAGWFSSQWIILNGNNLKKAFLVEVELKLKEICHFLKTEEALVLYSLIYASHSDFLGKL